MSVSATYSYSLGGRPRLLLVALAGVAALVGAGSAKSPFLVLTGVVGVVFVTVALLNLSAALAVFTALIFLEQIPTVSNSGLTFAKLTGGVLAIAWVRAATKRDSDIPLLAHRHPILAFSAVTLLCWTLASTVWASDPLTAGQTAARFAQGVLLIFVVFSAVSEQRHLRWIVYGFLTGAVATALVGLAGVTSAEGANISASDRLSGGIGDPNELAAILIPALSLAFFMSLTTKAVFPRLLLVAAAFVCAVALFRTESRGGLVGLAVMLLASVVISGPVRARVIVMVLALSGAALTYFALVAPPQSLARVTEFSSGGGSGRTDLWAVALDVSRAHPLGGVGAGNFPLVEPSYAFRNRNLPRFDLIVETPKVVHNMYLNILAELGVVGLILFSVVIVCAFAAAFHSLRAFANAGDLETEVLARGIIVGTIGMLAAFFFLSAQYDKQLPLLLGVLASLSSVARVRRAEGGRMALRAAPRLAAPLAARTGTRHPVGGVRSG